MLMFLITFLQGGSPTTLFYRFFGDSTGCDCGEDPKISNATICTCNTIQKAKKEQVAFVAERLHSVYQFHIATNPKSLETDIQILNSDDVVPEFEVGHFRLHEGEPFSSEMRVMWTAVNGLGIAFICHGHENRVQTEITLRVLVRQLHELCRLILTPNDIISKPAKVDIVLGKFVPDGNALLMNHRLIRQLERETEALLKGTAN